MNYDDWCKVYDEIFEGVMKVIVGIGVVVIECFEGMLFWVNWNGMYFLEFEGMFLKILFFDYIELRVQELEKVLVVQVNN